MTKYVKLRGAITGAIAFSMLFTGILYAIPTRSFAYSYELYGNVFVTHSKNSAPAADIQAVAAKAGRSVVYVNVYKSTSATGTGTTIQEVASGSGFFITPNGYILTSNHVVSDQAAAYKVNYNGAEVPAQVIYRDSENDTAIIKIEGSNFPALPLSNSSKIKVGEQVVAVGNALSAVTNFATAGNITALSKTITVDLENGSSEIMAGTIESNVVLFPGESGGPLLNTNGEVVAINTAIPVSEWGFGLVGYSIPINLAKKTIAKAGITL